MNMQRIFYTKYERIQPLSFIPPARGKTTMQIGSQYKVDGELLSGMQARAAPESCLHARSRLIKPLWLLYHMVIFLIIPEPSSIKPEPPHIVHCMQCTVHGEFQRLQILFIINMKQYIACVQCTYLRIVSTRLTTFWPWTYFIQISGCPISDFTCYEEPFYRQSAIYLHLIGRTIPQITYRVEMKYREGVYLPSLPERTLQAERGCTPHPHQPRLIFPSQDGM